MEDIRAYHFTTRVEIQNELVISPPFIRITLTFCQFLRIECSIRSKAAVSWPVHIWVQNTEYPMFHT